MRIAVAGGTGVVGRRIVESARARGHDVVVLARSHGVDLATGDGLASAVAGANVIVDASNIASSRRQVVTDYFVAATRHLHAAAHAAGVTHLVVLSIVGIDRVPGFAYYDAKVAQEAEARRGPTPISIVRATQFHEFAGQLLSRFGVGPVASIPAFPIQPVATRSVAELLVDVAEGEPGKFPEIGGPEVVDLVAAARATLARRGVRRAVLPVRIPGAPGRALRAGALLLSDDRNIAGPSFTQWLAGPEFV